MNFSGGIRVTGPEIKWSPNGKYLASAVTARLEIREGSSLILLHNFNCSHIIQAIEWSPDSRLVMTANYKQGNVQIWQPTNPTWGCKIDEGAAGLINISWSPDSLHILTTAEFYIRITVWSLANKSVSYIKNPKEANPGYAFSNDGEYLACAERKDCKDFISVLETKSWHLVKHFEVATQDLGGLAFNSDDSVIAIWDSPAVYKILIYMLNGQCLASYTAYQWALGIKVAAWSPGSQILAIKSFDQKIRMMNNITWSIICEIEHTSTIDSMDCVVFKEIEKPMIGYPATLASVKGIPPIAQTQYEEETSRPVHLAQTNEHLRSHSRYSIKSLQFSIDGRFLASIVDTMPTVVWIWSMPQLCLTALLVHTNPVRDMAWSHKQTFLAITCGNCHVYLWTPFGSLTVPVPTLGMQISCAKWHPSGTKLLLASKDQFTTCDLNTQVFRKKSSS